MVKLLTQTLGLEEAAQAFAALGSEQRLAVLQALVAAGPAGMSAGRLGQRTNIPASTLTHHLRFLKQAGLIKQQRDGRSIISVASFARVEQLSAYLLLNCCAEAEENSHEGHDHD